MCVDDSGETHGCTRFYKFVFVSVNGNVLLWHVSFHNLWIGTFLWNRAFRLALDTYLLVYCMLVVVRRHNDSREKSGRHNSLFWEYIRWNIYLCTVQVGKWRKESREMNGRHNNIFWEHPGCCVSQNCRRSHVCKIANEKQLRQFCCVWWKRCITVSN